jgi:hypothetical protein
LGNNFVNFFTKPPVTLGNRACPISRVCARNTFPRVHGRGAHSNFCRAHHWRSRARKLRAPQLLQCAPLARLRLQLLFNRTFDMSLCTDTHGRKKQLTTLPACDTSMSINLHKLKNAKFNFLSILNCFPNTNLKRVNFCSFVCI